MSTTYWTEISSAIGPLWLSADHVGLTGLFMEQPGELVLGADSWVRDEAPFAAVRDQLDAYFDGQLREFDVPLHLAGTPFQREVWTVLRSIPYGEIRSYRDIAEEIGRPTASRAVGAANGRNPVSVIVPCHRVVGSSGVLTGYAWGLERKRALLDLEASATGLPLPAPAVVA